MTTADVATRRRRLGSLLYEVLVILALAIFLFLLPLAVFSGVSHLMPGRGLLWLYLFVLLGIYFVWCWVKAGQTLAKTLQMVREFRVDNQTTPIVLMGYYNPIHRFGVDTFVAEAKAAGVDGLIIVDLPPEHDAELATPAQAAGIDFIRLTTPTTDDARLPRVLERSSGFVYYVSVAGVTGAGSATTEHVTEAIARLRRHTDLPISVGFGIRTPEQAANIARLADGVVVGSALVDKIAQAKSADQAVTDVLSLCSALAEGVRGARR